MASAGFASGLDAPRNDSVVMTRNVMFRPCVYLQVCVCLEYARIQVYGVLPLTGRGSVPLPVPAEQPVLPVRSADRHCVALTVASLGERWVRFSGFLSLHSLTSRSPCQRACTEYRLHLGLPGSPLPLRRRL